MKQKANGATLVVINELLCGKAPRERGAIHQEQCLPCGQRDLVEPDFIAGCSVVAVDLERDIEFFC